MPSKHIVRISPIDNRPCHTDFITSAMRDVATYELQMAPFEALGHFMTPGNLDTLDAFLLKDIETVDTLIVSLDGLAYGGLVQGRSVDESHDIAYFKQRLDILRTIRKLNPSITILAYSVIMRLTLTVTDSNNVSQWEDIFTYSQLVDKVKKKPEVQKELDTVMRRLDPSILKNYHATRDRNHEINKCALDFVSEGILDYVSLVQEDTSEYGLHVQEQAVLNTMIKTYNIDAKASIKNGTDEMVALLLARTLSNQTRIQLDAQYLDKRFIAHYEDKPAYENLMKSLEIAKVTLSDEPNIPVLIVLPNTEITRDLCFEPLADKPYLSLDQQAYYQTYQGRDIALLDIAYANGGDMRVLKTFGKNFNIVGYSAWNTSSNAMGTLILDCVIASMGKTNKDYIVMRIIDDALYQGIVRAQLNAYRKTIGEDLWSANYSTETEHKLNELLNQAIEANELTRSHKVHAVLPWGRSFEVRMEMIK